MKYLDFTLVALVLALLSPCANAFSGGTNPDDLHGYKCDKSFAGRSLDLADARVTFDDEFLRPSVTPPDGKGPWYAPVQGPFGLAAFLSPDSKYSPFSYNSGYLTIRMSKRGEKWYSGNMQTVNALGQGFSQKYGYFEIRAQFPPGMATWPAFWLGTTYEYTAKAETQAEIDIIEGYGGNDKHGFHATVHLWPGLTKLRDPENPITKHWMSVCYQTIPGGGLFDGNFHTYGGEITPDYVIVYFDRKEIARYKTLEEFKRPVFMRVDLAFSPMEKRTDDSPSDLVVDYVRAWQRPEWRGQ
jgi:hypothetical protein